MTHKRTKVQVEKLTNDIRRALYQGLNKYDIAKITNLPVEQIQWYINKVTAEDTEALSKYGEEVLFAEVAKSVGMYNEFIRELNGIIQSDEAMPKDQIDAIKVKMELITTKIGILSLGIKGNVKQIAEDAKKYSGDIKQIPGKSGNSSRHKGDDQAKTVVLRKDKPTDKLLPKPRGRPRKTPRHHERIGDDAIPDTTTGPGKQEEGY